MVRAFDAPIIANDQSVDRLASALVPVLLMFWDGRSLPDDVSQAMLKTAHDEAGNLIVARVNVRENPAAASRFDVHDLPQLVAVRQGTELTRALRPNGAEFLQQAQFVMGRGERPAGAASAGAQSTARLDHPIVISDAIFEHKVLQSSLPVLVDFWAPWCGPCHMIAPAVERIASDYAGKLVVAKVNVDENPHYAGVYGVQGIPTLLMFRGGKVINRLTGALPEAHLRVEVDRFLMQH